MFSFRNVLCPQKVNILLKTFNFSLKMNFSSKSWVKNIEFRTCGQLYEELKKTKPTLYRNSPSDGLLVNVEYADTFTQNKETNDMKTVVAIHGNPGHFKHFNGLIEYFSQNDGNVRVIVPNMPDFSITRKTMAFWHSNEERAQFIRDFLKAIDVSTIDCLICHSAGIQPISLIWTNPKELTIKSIGIFNPQYITQKFFDINRRLSIFSRNKFGIFLMDLMKPHILVRGRSPMNYESVDEVLYFLLVHSYLRVSDLDQRLEVLKLNKIPTLLVYGENDKLIPKHLYQKMAHKLGTELNETVIYSENSQIESDAKQHNWKRVVVFRGGGHFSFAKYNEEVIQQMLKHCLQSKL